MQTEILALAPMVSACADVTAVHLAAVAGRLNLFSETITSLQSGDFSGLSGVTTLDLGSNDLTTVPANAFSGLTSLTTLNLSRNLLATLPDNAFGGLTNLTELDLTGNTALAAVPVNALGGLTSLTTLRLSSNGLTTVPDNAFSTLTNLTRLELSSNSLTTVPVNAFSGLTSLTTLFLTDNGLTTLPVNVFSGLTSLTTLGLGDNSLAALPVGAFTGLMPGVDIFGIALPAAPGNLSATSVAGALVASWSEVSGAHYYLSWKRADAAAYAPADAAALGATSYTIENLILGATYDIRVAALFTDPAATTISATWRAGAAQAAVLASICGRTARVQTAILAEIAGVSACADVTAAHLAAVTGRINLARQSIGSLQVGDFGGLTSLTELDLPRNGFTTLPANVFSGLTSLTRLNVADNSLSTLPANVFSGLTSLTSLSLRDNALPTLPADAFSGLTSLTTMLLSGNALATLPANAFGGLPKLQELYLGDNRLTTLAANAFSGLTSLETLSLSGNSLAALPAGAFSGLPFGVEIIGIAIPAAPGNLTATPAARALEASWSAVAGAHYYLSWKRADAAVYAPADMIAQSATNYTIANLAAATTYDIRIAAMFNAPASTGTRTSWRAAATQASVLADAPSAPQNVRAASGDTELAISWDAPLNNGGAPVTTYQLRWKEAGAAQFATSDAAATAFETTTYTITGLANGTTYAVEVAAQNVTGIGAYAEIQATPRTIPDVLQNVTVTPGTTELIVAWTAPTGAAISGYKIRWATAAAPGEYLNAGRADGADVTGGGSATTHTIAGLTTGAVYQVQVAAVNSHGRGGWSAAQTATPGTPSAPRDVAAILPGNAKLTLTWSAPERDGGADIENYRARWAEGADSVSWINPPGASGREIRGGASTLTYTLSGLTNGSVYAVQIAAENSRGAGAWSASQSGMPMQTAPGAPQSVSSAISDATLMLSWDAPANDGGAAISDYQVRWKAAGASAWANPAGENGESAGADDTAYDITGLTNGTTYEAQVAAVNSIARGAWSASHRNNPATPPVDAPGNLMVQNGAGLLNLAWTAPANDGGDAITGYAVRWAEGAGSISWVIPPGENGAATESTDINYTLTGLKGGTTYEIQVAARNDAGTGAWTASAQGATISFNLDVDANGMVEWQDGVMIARHLAGVRGAGLVTGMGDGLDAATVAAKINSGVLGGTLNVDGANGTTAADGIMIARYLLGVISGDALTEGMTATAHVTVAGNIAGLPRP
ncbi:MAG: fibronectin type III domain-containing protein [Gammaproteobacteria bacterium]